MGRPAGGLGALSAMEAARQGRGGGALVRTSFAKGKAATVGTLGLGWEFCVPCPRCSGQGLARPGKARGGGEGEGEDEEERGRR
jgi:hypothetical protein